MGSYALRAPKGFRLLDWDLLGLHLECKTCGWIYFLGGGEQAITPQVAAALHVEHTGPPMDVEVHH